MVSPFSTTNAKAVGLLHNTLVSDSFLVVGLDSRSKHSTDGGFIAVSLKPDRGTDVFLLWASLPAGSTRIS